MSAGHASDLAPSVDAARVIVTTGAGGVGKTTTAAALGVAAARRGRDVLVLTIDPARRLAQALGLDELGDAPQEVELQGADGRLRAMMLDMQSTFDALIDEHAASREHAERIKTNRIYRTLSGSLAGTQEYMAMEKLHELHVAGGQDLLVVDTPPTRSALDFLDAPERMTSFLDGRLLGLLMKPAVATGRGYLRLVNSGASAFMRVAGRVTGMDLLTDLSQFFGDFEGMYEGFKRRAEEVLQLLREPGSRFAVVASPRPPALREARFFLDRLASEDLHAAGVVVNRVRPDAPDAVEPPALRAEAAHLDTAAAGAVRLLADALEIGIRERADVAAALHGRDVPALVEIPRLRGDVHDEAGLTRIADLLVGAQPITTRSET